MFLEEVAKYLVREGIPLESACIVFPNRRSGLFFKRFLIQHTREITWAPSIFTINELMQDICGLELSDPLEILFRIHAIHTSHSIKPETFDTFYPWAEMMLGDFDNLDKYLVDPVSLFRNISELKEIDEQFGELDEEQVEFIRQFWKSFHQGGQSPEKDAFLSTWKLLPAIYRDLILQLKMENKAYEGMIYRTVAEMDAPELDAALEAAHYYFVGFNALSKSERRFFTQLKNMQRASFFWDYDEHYLADESMEAGKFLRENLKHFPPPADLEIFDSFSTEKEIRIYDLPSDILQAKTVYKLLKSKASEVVDANDTAVIACDENLLMPVLYSLPPNIEMVNVTMGYPFSNTPLNSFIESLLRLHKNVRRTEKDTTRFYHKDVLSLLNHEYYKMVGDADPSVISREIIDQNQIYISPDYFIDAFGRLLFTVSDSVQAFGEYLRMVVQYLVKKFSMDEDEGRNALDLEYLLVIMGKLNILSARFQNETSVSIETYIRILRKILKNLRIPFTGEPLAGLQVMGILETRLLDFNHVIMLSVNEDIMPNTSAGHSFIPYSLRYAYELPTREEQDAIYAYYFYRAIQRAAKVDLLFKSASDGVKTGEMSRYLYQMKYIHDARIIRPVLPVTSSEIHPLEIKKSPEIMAALARYTEDNEEESYLSPSSLNTYIECSLKFYFRKILNIAEQEELLEELDPIGFGNVLHHTIQHLYEAISGNGETITPEALESILADGEIEEVLRHEFNREFYKGKTGRKAEGRNIIILAILKKYILQIIKTDKKIAPFNILELEKKYMGSLHTGSGENSMRIRIGGKIDRIDQLESGVIRIIDYKTGNPESRIESIESLFEYENKNRNKEAFQAFVYASLYLDHASDNPVQPGLYVTRKMFDPSFSPYFTLGKGRDNILTDFTPCKADFMARLKQVVEDLYNPGIPFTQTTVQDRCSYCDFKEICQRV